jgi:hypothetical protein
MVSWIPLNFKDFQMLEKWREAKGEKREEEIKAGRETHVCGDIYRL